jgi:hypothetical protein
LVIGVELFFVQCDAQKPPLDWAKVKKAPQISLFYKVCSIDSFIDVREDFYFYSTFVVMYNQLSCIQGGTPYRGISKQQNTKYKTQRCKLTFFPSSHHQIQIFNTFFWYFAGAKIRREDGKERRRRLNRLFAVHFFYLQLVSWPKFCCTGHCTADFAKNVR